jgi:hypothetical protein
MLTRLTLSNALAAAGAGPSCATCQPPQEQSGMVIGSILAGVPGSAAGAGAPTPRR